MAGKKRHEETIRVPMAEVVKWNDLLDAEWTDYETWEFPQYETVFCVTATFDDGNQMDVKVNTGSIRDGDFFAEAVLFDADGHQLGYTEPHWQLDGPPWEVLCDGEVYAVQLKGEEDEGKEESSDQRQGKLGTARQA